MSCKSTDRNFSLKIRNAGLFQIEDSGAWINKIDCGVCLEKHFTHQVILSNVDMVPQDLPAGSVRLSDGISQVDIMYEPTCIDEPFRNLAKQLSKSLKLQIISAHQVFDSIEQLVSLLAFSAPGEFFSWDEPQLSVSEQYEVEMGHLIKLNYRRSPESELLDVVIEFEEFEKVTSNYLGEKARGFGVEVTVSGAEAFVLEEASRMIQGVLDDYARLLAPATSGD